jgi:autotransporter-associated beta strand protein
MTILKDAIYGNESNDISSIEQIASLNNTIIALQESLNVALSNIIELSSGSLSVPSGSTLTSSIIIGGTTDINKTGEGTLYLSGSNTYTGDTNVLTGSLLINGVSNLPNTNAINLSTGTSLKIQSNSTASFDRTINGAGGFIASPGPIPTTLYFQTTGNSFTGGFTIASGQSVSIAYGWDLGSHIYIQVDGSLLLNLLFDTGFSLVFGGSGKIVKEDTKNVTFSSPNTYTGGTDIYAGTLIAGYNECFGTGPITVYPGATLNLFGYTVSNEIINYGGTVIP